MWEESGRVPVWEHGPDAARTERFQESFETMLTLNQDSDMIRRIAESFSLQVRRREEEEC